MNREDLEFVIDRQGAPRVSRLGHVYALHDNVAVLEIEMSSKRHTATGTCTRYWDEAHHADELEIPVVSIFGTEDSIGLNADVPAFLPTRLVFPRLGGWTAYICFCGKYNVLITLLKDCEDTQGARND